MGYNSNLSEKRNSALHRINTPSNNVHPIWIVGTLLRIVGALIVISVVMFIVGTGGWGMLILVSPLAIIPYGGILLFAIGQYFVSNWKNR